MTAEERRRVLAELPSVRPETRIFVRDQGLRKILPQVYS